MDRASQLLDHLSRDCSAIHATRSQGLLWFRDLTYLLQWIVGFVVLGNVSVRTETMRMILIVVAVATLTIGPALCAQEIGDSSDMGASSVTTTWASSVPSSPIPSTSIPTFSVPTSPVEEVAIPTSEIPTVSIPEFSVPGLSIPAVVIPTSTIPEFSLQGRSDSAASQVNLPAEP